ncbi:hypothetical protein CCP3SC1_2160001 [Gammaproteobacteria bacterium]
MASTLRRKSTEYAMAFNHFIMALLYVLKMIVENGKIEHQPWLLVLPIMFGQFMSRFPFQLCQLGQRKAPPRYREA